MPPRLKIFFDGGCRPAPDGMEIAVAMGGKVKIVRDLGSGSCMEAEWLALQHALHLARDLPVDRIVLLGDAMAVIGQATGAVKCRGDNIRHLEAFRLLTGTAGPPRIRYIKRAQNLAGIALDHLPGR